MNMTRAVAVLLGLVALAPGLPVAGLELEEQLPTDPALIIDTLPNGMRYYIRANPTPAKRAFLWLAVNAGSVQEDDDQRGFAHFLEHMAFNGTENFPRHELISTLQLAGMRFGPDINAYTSFDETVYMLEVPTDRGEFLTDGLTMLEDWAGGGILMDSAEVVAERGVVLGEWRSRMLDSASQLVVSHRDSVLYGAESRYVTRPPIGQPKLLASAEPGPLWRFYRDWYRPDLMAVIAVGDFDPKEMERAIRDRFGRIPAPANSRPRVSPHLPSDSAPLVDIFRGRTTPSIVALWKRPTRRVNTPAAFREQLVEELLFDGLNRKLLRMRRQEGRPFFSASIGRGGLAGRDTDARMLQVIARPDSLERGLAAALAELERVARHGPAAATLERQKAALVRRLESAVTTAASTPSSRFARAYVAHYLQGTVPLMNATQRLELAREVLPTIAPDDLARAAAFWRGREDMVLLYSQYEWARVAMPTREDLLAILDSVAMLELAPDSVTGESGEAQLMAELPEPGKIASETHHAAAGITEWRLSNGARVLLKPTHSNPDEILLDARSPGGFSLVPDPLFFSSGRLVAKMMTEAAGLGSLDRDRLLNASSMTGLRELEVSITHNDESIRVGGSPSALEMLFQVLHLQFTAPKLDTAALGAWKRVGEESLAPSMDEQITAMLARSHPRRAPMPMTSVAFANVDKAMAVYRDRFGNAGDFTFTIVGAATPEQVRPLVERYLASLPSTAAREQPKPIDVRPLNNIMRATTRTLEVPKASTFLLFDGPFPAAPEEYLDARARLGALGWVLRLRFTDVMRERMAGTYSVGVAARTYADPEEHFRVTINFDAAPERIHEMLDTLSTVLEAVRTTDATPDELEKIAAMQRRAREVALQDNRHWLRTIQLFDRLDIPLDRIIAPPPSVTPAEIRAAASRYLPAHAYIHYTVLPRDSTLACTHCQPAIP